VWVDYEDPATGRVRRKRVLRTEPEGVNFLTEKRPDLRLDPGLVCGKLEDVGWAMSMSFYPQTLDGRTTSGKIMIYL
jgi:hypothetical protein